MVMITSWNPLKSCRVPLNKYLREKNYSLDIMHSMNSQEIHHRNTLAAAFKFLLQRQLKVSTSATEGRGCIIDSGDEN